MENNLNYKKIKILNGFEYSSLNDIESFDWALANTNDDGKITTNWYSGSKDKLIELLNKNKLIKDNNIYIPSGEYDIIELHYNDWTFKVGDFAITTVPNLSDNPNFEVQYELMT